MRFPDGATARSLVHLTPEINAAITELAMAGRQRAGYGRLPGTLEPEATTNLAPLS